MKVTVSTLIVGVVLLLILMNVRPANLYKELLSKPASLDSSSEPSLIETRGIEDKKMPTFPIPETTTGLQELSPGASQFIGYHPRCCAQ